MPCTNITPASSTFTSLLCLTLSNDDTPYAHRWTRCAAGCTTGSPPCCPQAHPWPPSPLSSVATSTPRPTWNPHPAHPHPHHNYLPAAGSSCRVRTSCCLRAGCPPATPTTLLSGRPGGPAAVQLPHSCSCACCSSRRAGVGPSLLL